MNISFKGYRTYTMEGTQPPIGRASSTKLPYLGGDIYTNTGNKAGEICWVDPDYEKHFDIALSSTPGVTIIDSLPDDAYPSPKAYFNAVKSNGLIDRVIGRREAPHNSGSIATLAQIKAAD